MDEAPNLSSTVSPPRPALHARGHNPGGSRVDPASRRLDLNADMGESFGVWTLGNDAELMPLVTSANIACGFHAGDPGTIAATVALAIKHNVAIGAHPSLPDLAGFGRRNLAVTPEEVYDLTLYQSGAVRAFAEAAGGRLHHIKAHGALYNMAARDRTLARALAEAARALGGGLRLYVLAGSLMEEEALEIGVEVRREVFADRRYLADGNLAPRSRPDALITDENEAVHQVLRMVGQGHLIAVDGSVVPVSADTLCIHGDKPTAVPFVHALRAALDAHGVRLTAD